MEISASLYIWFKAAHIISVIAWMAGLLYLPRLFVYHCQAEVGSDKSETFKIMERRLLRAIMNPAMIASLLFGGLMVWGQGSYIWTEIWFLVKIAGLVVLMGIHMQMGAWRKAFEQDRNQKSEKFFRVINEAPTLLMILIVIMAVVKPG